MGALTNQTILERDAAREGWSETFVTARVGRPLDSAAEVRETFEELADHLARRHVEVVQEKVYGLVSRREEIEEARRAAYASLGVEPAPATFIEGRPCVGGLLAGVQLIGVLPTSAAVSVTTIEDQGAPVGRVLETPTHRAIFLSGVSDPACAHAVCVTDQSARMFARVADLLEEQGFQTGDIVRTWIYLPRLLDWYGEFNRVRTACFRRWGLIGENSVGILPASTGIQGRRRDGEECFMDVFALSRKDGTRTGIHPMRNTRQNEAYEYGSSFSRGMAVAVGGPAALYISGTASIDPRGRTVYHADHQGQVLETLLDVHALIQTEGAAFRDICQATAYCKEERDYGMLLRVLDFLDWRDMPVIPVYADVCRDELLFELDAIALAR